MLAVNLIVHRLQSHDGSLILCWRRIRKFDENKQTHRWRTDNSVTEATLISVDRWGERANNRGDSTIKEEDEEKKN